MRLITGLLLVSALQVSAKSAAQKVTLDKDNASLDEILNEIHQQTGYLFLYDSRTLEDVSSIDIHVKRVSLQEVLDKSMAKYSLGYLLKDSTIVVFKKNEVEKYLKPSRKIEGSVTDDKGEALAGVTVRIKNSNVGTITDAKGRFSLEIPGDNTVLQFSFLGFQAQELTVGTSSSLSITMRVSSNSLNQLVVVGYGTQKKTTLTGSVSTVSGDELTKSQAINVSTSLEGRLPGLVVNQRTGIPGSEGLDITIRGASTFNDNSPLVVIDGVPRGSGIMSMLNPQDIESVTVLKDASAAIYGARAANGVILVTTKKGSKSKPVYSLSYTYGFTNPTKIPDMMDAALFAQVVNETQSYLGGSPVFTDEAIQKYRDGSDPLLYPNTDWPAVSLNKNPAQQKVNFQASGGSEKVRYLFSFGAATQGSNYKNQPYSYKQYNGRVRVDADLTKDLTVSANIGAFITNRSEANGTDFVTILQANPTLAAVYPNGLIAPGRFGNNPLLSNRRGYNKWIDDPITTTFTASYKVPFIKGLALDASYNYDLRNQFYKSFSKPHEYSQYDASTGKYLTAISNDPISVSDTYSRWQTILANFRISYKTTVARDHNISAMVGTEQQQDSYSYANAYRKNFVSPAIPQINVGSTNPSDLNNGGSASNNAYNNFFGRANYNYKSKYLLEFLFRYDGSPIFPAGKRYGFFPGVSAGWRLSQEKFMQNVKFVDELKLRGSYGELGNDRVSPYQYLQAFGFGNNFVLGGKDVPGIYSNTLPNPNITWEVSKKLDFGLEASLWHELLDVDITVFHERRSNILLAPVLAVSDVYGFPDLPDQNIGEVQNHGFEINLTHRNTIGQLTYSVTGNVSYARSKIIYMDETPPSEPYQEQTGHPLGSSLYYKSDGIFHTQAELDAYPHGAGAKVGDIKIVDLNHDNEIDGRDRYRTDNSPTPEYVFGLSANLQYKGFDLTLFFQGQTKGYSYDGTVDEFGLTDLDNGTVYRATNRWTVNNQAGATMPRANDWQPGTTDFFLYDATFARLKNVELGYTLSNDLAKKAGITDIRIFANATNALTWAKQITWRDPEMSGSFTAYPPLRIITFGVSAKF